MVSPIESSSVTPTTPPAIKPADRAQRGAHEIAQLGIGARSADVGAAVRSVECVYSEVGSPLMARIALIARGNPMYGRQ
jgi:hypothetical protein